MIHCSLSDLYKAPYVFLWMLLSFKAGFLNAAGFLTTGRFVSHVTGFGTQVGVSLAHEDYYFGIELLIIPIAFIGGSMIPALILEKDYNANKIPAYPLVQAMITGVLILIASLGMSGWFGDFDTVSNDFNDIVLIGFLCFVCGMKNGLTSWATGGKIRTTHITGLSTDIGLHLPKIFRGSQSGRYPELRRINKLRMAFLASFTMGSLVSAFVFPRLGYYGFLFPVGISIFLLAVSVLNYKASTAVLIPDSV